jgi:hypothetical protein
MHDIMRPVEVKILQALHGVEEPIGEGNLRKRMSNRSPSCVSLHLTRLENKGLIEERRPYQHKAIRLTPAGHLAAMAAVAAAKEAA